MPSANLRKASTCSDLNGGCGGGGYGGFSFGDKKNSLKGLIPSSKKSVAHPSLDLRDFAALERGHRVCKLAVLKKFDIGYQHLWLNSHTHQITLSKWGNTNDEPGPSTSSSAKTQTLDLRLIKEAQVLNRVGHTMQIADKWRRDSMLQRFDPDLVLIIQWGSVFVLNSWAILFDTRDACHLWCKGLQQLCAEQLQYHPHALVVERWLRKQFFALLPHPTNTASVTMKHMKPFVQQRLQCKVNSKQLQEITEGEMGFEAFVLAHNRLLNFHALFDSMFSEYSDGSGIVPFQRFVDFLRDVQHDELGQSRDLASDFLRRYLRDVDPDRDVPEPWLATDEFVEYLYGPENSLFDPLNREVVQDMSRPLTHYWISSSHNTYLTGDQLKSESSLDAYARALLMGCRCIELDCWDGPHQRRSGGSGTVPDIVIYHGYTMTSKLALRDVLHTIRRYAFQASDFPLVLSIEDNCSVPAQRQMAVEIKEVLGDLLLTAPVSRDEWQLPSPAALRRKIILKHKKLQLHNDSDALLAAQGLEDELEQDILSRRCAKKGVLWLRGDGCGATAIPEWSRHIFVLFNDRLCHLLQRVEEQTKASTTTTETPKLVAGREDSLSSQQEDGYSADDTGSLNADSCADAHVAEEWFHGKIDREDAKARLLDHARQLQFGGDNSNTRSASGDGDNGVHGRLESGDNASTRHQLNGFNDDHDRYITRGDNGQARKLSSVGVGDHRDNESHSRKQSHLVSDNDNTRKQSSVASNNNTRRQKQASDGVFLVRESTTFIGDFTLSFVHAGTVHHCRIKASMGPGGERRYHLLDSVKRDTLYELISFYTRHPLDTPNFKTFLQTPCPQPQPHLDQPWYCAHADTQRAEELLNTVARDGAFLVRHSSADRSVFVLSLRANDKLFHYRLKREGRLFVVAHRVFESLNQLVEHYSQQPFVRGVCLSHPVNERTVSQYANDQLAGIDQQNQQLALELGGCYMDLKDLDKETRAEAVEAFDGIVDGEDGIGQQKFAEDGKLLEPLRFPVDAEITVLRKAKNEENDQQKQQNADEIWIGRYNNEIGWFPARCVRELDAPNAEAGSNGTDTLNYGTIELAGTSFEQCDAERPHAFRIRLTHTHWDVREYVVAASSAEEQEEWLGACQHQAAQANDKMHALRTREKQLRIASELSSLVVYCQAVPFNAHFELQDPRVSFYEMCSFSESKHDKLVERGLMLFNQRQLSRVYPQASRFTSTNFNPVPMWNSGCHMVALNFQTGDKAMQLNAGRFMANGRCGYVLKPRYMMDEMYTAEQQQQQKRFSASSDNFNKSTDSDGGKTAKSGGGPAEEKGAGDEHAKQRQQVQAVQQNNFGCPLALNILLIAGRHLARKSGQTKAGGICSPFVELEVLGHPDDSQSQKSGTITSNGLNPVWKQRFLFLLRRPEMALLRFCVEDGDFVGPKTDPFIGQAVFPLDCLRPGFRSVPLLNQFSEPLELSALLVHVEFRPWDPSAVVAALCPVSAMGRRSNSWMATNGQTEGTSPMFDTGPPLYNPHKLLQAGRSVLAQQQQQSQEGDQDPTAGSSLKVLHAWPTAPAALNHRKASTGNCGTVRPMTTDNRLAPRSASIESGDQNLPMPSTSSSGRKANTLRRLFRLGRANNNNDN